MKDRLLNCLGGMALLLVSDSVAAESPQQVFAGNVVASDMAGLSYEARGCIVSISDEAKRGGMASVGQTLVELDRQKPELALRSAQAKVADLQAAVDERQLSIDAASADKDRRAQEVEFVAREFKRNETMFRRGLINESTMETVERRMMDANFAADRAKEALAGAQSAKARAEIALEIGQLELQRAQVDLEALRIVAPIDGVLVGFEPNVGDCVQEGALAAKIYAPSEKAVEFFVLIDQLSKEQEKGVSIGAPMRITRASGAVCGGVVTRIDTEANLETQYVKSSIEVEEGCAAGLFLNEAVEVEVLDNS
ncbi:HlyD family efflux transporter periplasmic adaptor subunit [Alisedimentitalea sp. MJ-SS2]|uniref:HlyD family secretion protein n=1 Tax=Aliisedimentitalea sp. MJ-SS2 TaxID=3049795 RepID=UPI0029086107|nr:HlyD family efflux transporter periplasmic adaptor subunit [Alisedimentitalea sp. MJ-SS2]MDU8928551.1 HlyD family efflux transporter periplasmic adaptor subunit [Alisedimentitalea sp. MJ-SS2]